MSQRLHDLAGVQEVGPVGRIAKEDRFNPGRRGWRRRRDRNRRRDRLRRGLGGRREGWLVARPDLPEQAALRIHAWLGQIILLNPLADQARAAPNLSAALTTARARASQALPSGRRAAAYAEPGNQAKPPPKLSARWSLSLCSHSLRQRPTRRRSGWSARKTGRQSNRRSARPPRPSPNIAASSRKPDACNFSRARLARSQASCSGSTKRTRRRATRSRPASWRRRCPKASTGSPTRLKTLISPRSASCSRCIGTTASRPNKAPKPSLVAPEEIDAIKIQRIAEAIGFGRDLVNAPANVLGPDALEQEAVKLAERFDASVTVVRGDELHRRQFSPHPRGRTRGRRSAAARRLFLGTRGRAESFDHRQGRDVRHRRSRHQAALGHGAHEEGHGRGGDGADAGADDHGGGARSSPQDADPDRRERDLGAGDATGRRDRQPQGDLGRSRQHRRRGADDPGRRARARRRGRAGTHVRLRHADRRGAGRARPGPAALLHRRRRACRFDRRPFRARARSRVAPAALAALRRDDRGVGRRHQQFGHRRRHGGLDHRRALSSALRGENEGLGAFRRLRLEPEAARPWAGGRRDPGGAGVCSSF